MWRSRPDMREQYILYMSLGSLLKQGSTMSQDLSRRKMIAALGIGAVGAVAGCIGAPVNAETPPPEDETEDVVAELDPPARSTSTGLRPTRPTCRRQWTGTNRANTTSPFARRSSSRRSSPVSRSST